MSDTLIKRRRVPRRDYDNSVGVLVLGRYFICRAHQIGEGGMMLEMSESLKEGQRLVVTFKLPQAPPVVVLAIVRYRLEKANGSDLKYGVEFLNLDFQARREIRNYVASKSEAEYKKAASA